MAKASRAKGLAFEREVAKVYQEHGFEVRGLEGEGDHLCIKPRQLYMGHDDMSKWERTVIFSECKRQERIQLPAWIRQAKTEAPAGTVPVVAFRQNRMEIYGCLPLRDLLRLV